MTLRNTPNHSTLFFQCLVEQSFVLLSTFVFGLENNPSYVNKMKNKYVFSMRYESKIVILKFLVYLHVTRNISQRSIKKNCFLQLCYFHWNGLCGFCMLS